MAHGAHASQCFLEKPRKLLCFVSQSDAIDVSDRDSVCLCEIAIGGQSHFAGNGWLRTGFASDPGVGFAKHDLGHQTPYGYDLVRKLDEPSTLRANKEIWPYA